MPQEDFTESYDSRQSHSNGGLPHQQPQEQERQEQAPYVPPPDTPHYPEVPLVKTLLAWTAPGRPYRKRRKEYFINIIIITIAAEVILFLFGQWMLMVLAASLVFLNFALALIPPQPFHYKISTEGIKIEDHYFIWQELYDFYFKHMDNTNTLVLRTKSYMPGELIVTLGDVHEEQVRAALLPYLPYREYMKPSFIERSSDWLAKTFPLEKKASHVPTQPQ